MLSAAFCTACTCAGAVFKAIYVNFSIQACVFWLEDCLAAQTYMMRLWPRKTLLAVEGYLHVGLCRRS